MTAPGTQRVAVVTGATSGVGHGVAQRLGEAGYRVVMVCRDAVRAEGARARLSEVTGTDAYEIALADLCDFAAVRRVAAEVRGRHPRVDALVNVAGVVSMKRRLTPAGHELTLAAGFLGAFALTDGLLPALARSDAGRIVNVAGRAYRKGAIDLEDLHFARRRYSALRAGAQAMLAKVLWTTALQPRLEGSGVRARVCGPGLVRSGLLRDAPLPLRAVAQGLIAIRGQSPYEGAATPAMLATDLRPEDDGHLFYRRGRGHAIGGPGASEALADALWAAASRATAP